MEGIESLGLSSMSTMVKKQRSASSRRSRSDPHFVSEFRIRSDRMFRNNENDGSDLRRCSEDVFARGSCKRAEGTFEEQLKSPNGYVGKNADGQSVEASNVSSGNKLRKLKLKDSAGGGHPASEKRNSLQGISWKDFEEKGSSHGAKEHLQRKVREENLPQKQADKPQCDVSSEPSRRSNRVRKRRVLDAVLDDSYEDDGMCYLSRLRTSNITTADTSKCEDDRGNVQHNWKSSRVSKITGSDVDEDSGLFQPIDKDMEQTRSENEYNHMECVEEEGAGADTKPKARKQRTVSVDPQSNARLEPLVTRQRALQAGTGASLIEFPDGLPSAPPRKQKEKPSELEQQLKKEEAALRRRKKAEKEAKEAQEKAIRKIRGQDSKRENNKEKSQEVPDEEEEAALKMLPSNTVRWISGPTGTVITFPEEVGLPSILNSKPCSYPPPRETCASPLCTNAYKYRDSKLNLPLCSLRCYRAVHQSAQPLTS